MTLEITKEEATKKWQYKSRIVNAKKYGVWFRLDSNGNIAIWKGIEKRKAK